MGGLPFPGPLVLAVINLAFRMFPEVLVEILFGWRCVPRDPPPGYTRGRERGGERESVRVTESEAVCMIYRERLALSCVCVCVCVCVFRLQKEQVGQHCPRLSTQASRSALLLSLPCHPRRRTAEERERSGLISHLSARFHIAIRFWAAIRAAFSAGSSCWSCPLYSSHSTTENNTNTHAACE